MAKKHTHIRSATILRHVHQLPILSFFPIIYYVQELGAEIAQLEKQRDELEAELKKVI